MLTKLNQWPALALLLVLGIGPTTNVQAASLTFIPVTPTQGLSAGDSVSLQVWLDFSDIVDDNGNPVGTVGGGFNILFDAEVLEYTSVDFIPIGDPVFATPPDYNPGQPNQLDSWTMGDFNGIVGPIMAGTVNFQVIANTAFVTDVKFSSTSSIDGGVFINAADYSMVIDTDYGDISLTGVPLPGGALLLVSALAFLRLSGASVARSND